jgi:hypothetical protein
MKFIITSIFILGAESTDNTIIRALFLHDYVICHEVTIYYQVKISRHISHQMCI